MLDVLLSSLKSKTMWLGLVLALLSAANLYLETALSPEIYSLVGGGFAIAISWVRAKTTTPLLDK